VRYAVGLFTNLTQDHLDFHETMENYAEAKALLFKHCDKACANLDDSWFDAVMKNAESVYTFSAKRHDADLAAHDVRLESDSVRFCAMEGSELCRTKLCIPGAFSVYNALSAIACCRLLGVGLRECCEALESCRGAKGRVESVPTDGDYSIFIDYAVTPDAIENVLSTLRQVAPRRLVMLFGCGGDRDRKKRPIMGEISARLADFVVVTSDNPRTEDPEAIIADILAGMEEGQRNVHVEPDRRKAIGWALEQGRPGDVIILAGKGHETSQEVAGVLYPMDEREIVADWFQNHGKRQEKSGNLSAAHV